MKISVSQLSLAAFYGEKDINDLWDKIDDIQKLIEDDISNKYESYTKEQIHGTIIGLEGVRLNDKLLSKNYKELVNKEYDLELDSILEYIINTEMFPITIKIGGYQNNKKYSFTSRGEIPYNRSFSVQRDTLVAMGWPYKDNNYTPILDTLRRELGKLGGLHKYHDQVNSFDNDFFFVLGNLKFPLTENEKNNLQLKIRNEMTSWNETYLTIHKDDLRVIQYEDTKFRNANAYKIKDAIKNINFLKKCYPEINFAHNRLTAPDQKNR